MKAITRFILTGVLCLAPFILQAESNMCPTAKEVGEHAANEGIGAQWTTADKLNWYLDYFSNNKKPAAAAISKFTFIQSLLDGQQLTCYYEWPDEAGQTTSWMTIRLKSAQKVKPLWEGGVCKNFEPQNCLFSLVEAAPANANTTAAPTATNTSTSATPAAKPLPAAAEQPAPESKK